MNMGSYKCCQINSDEFEKIRKLSSLLKLIGEESRLKLLCLLKNGEHCVCEVLEEFEMSQSLVSHHLSDLKEIGLVIDRKQGRRVYYSLTEKGKDIVSKIFSF